mgnify:CR=1 FL=1
MPHTKETSLPTAEQLDMERRRLRYKRRYNRTLRSTVAILIVVAALAVLAATLWMPVLRTLMQAKRLLRSPPIPRTTPLWSRPWKRRATRS